MATLRAEAVRSLAAGSLGYGVCLARLNTLTRSLPWIPLRSALRTWCTTTGQRLHRGLLRQHFFLGLRSSSLLDFKWPWSLQVLSFS